MTMLTVLATILAFVAAVHAMSTGNVAATVFFCFCLNCLRDCFVVVEEDEDG